jgi:hypothetical protein
VWRQLRLKITKKEEPEQPSSPYDDESLRSEAKVMPINSLMAPISPITPRQQYLDISPSGLLLTNMMLKLETMVVQLRMKVIVTFEVSLKGQSSFSVILR